VIRSFEPLERADARVLVLGSIPGRISLQRGEYYAHPRNAFWSIMCGLFGIEETATYEERVRALIDARVAVWDVLHSASREGSSLDSAIATGTEAPNDLPGFVRAHPDLTAVFFNGAKAESAFLRHTLATMPRDREIEYHRLPSTSPAHASLSSADKLERWRRVGEAASGMPSAMGQG